MKRLGLFLVAALGWSASASAAVVDRVAAVVNDDVIALSEVYDLGAEFIEQRAGGSAQARREAELEVVDSLVMRRLISQEIERLGLDVTDEELNRTVVDIARRNGLDEASLRGEVEASGMPWAEYQVELRENLRQMKFSQAVVQPRITVDEDELLDAYKRLVAGADVPEIAQLGAIFMRLPPGDPEAQAAVMQRAADARARIEGGESFSTVAVAVDEGPYGASGGKMGEYRRGDLVDQLDELAFGLPVGGTSVPVVTPQGVFLLHVFSREKEATAAFEDVREQLMEQVYAGRIEEETDQWYRQARRRAAVLIKLEPAADL